jgi:hypothetical protein
VADDSDGSLTRKSTYNSTATVTAVSITYLGYTSNSILFGTGSRDASGNLNVNAWQVDVNGVITALGSASAGAVSQVAVDFTPNSQIVSVVRNGNGNLEVTTWLVGNGLITRQGSASAGAIKHISAAHEYNGSQDLTASAVINGSGLLEIILWQVDSAGTVTRVGSQNGAAASQVAICNTCLNYLSPPPFTATRNSSGHLAGELWSVSPLSEIAQNATSSPASAVVATTTNYFDNLLTVARDSNGNLQLQVWGYGF